jgi:hypothetical protein
MQELRKEIHVPFLREVGLKKEIKYVDNNVKILQK